MQHIQGISRQQLRMSSLEDAILQDNPVRFIEAFVIDMSLYTLGFSAQTIAIDGTKSSPKTRNMPRKWYMFDAKP